MSWDWQVFCKNTLDGEVIASCFGSNGDMTYLQWMLSAWGWTLSVALLALVLALVVGSLMGILRTTPSRALVALGNGWTELFRNIPLLVQIFLWYHVLPSLFTSLRVVPPFALVVFALGFFTSARIAEQVKAGIQSRGPGRRFHAAANLPLRAAADGLSHRHPAADQREHEHRQELVGGLRGQHRGADHVLHPGR
jgi:glutamate/aspartate transport system permease protein